MPSPSCFSPAWLSVPDSLTRSRVPTPPVFLKNDSVTTVPRFPRPGPPEQRSPASAALSGHYDFLRRIPGRLWIRFPAPTSVSSFAPRRRRPPPGPGPVYSPVPSAAQGWSNTGSPRFLENPSHTFAPLFDPGRSPSLTFATHRVRGWRQVVALKARKVISSGAAASVPLG